MANTIEHKIGDTFIAYGVYKNPNGTPVNLTTGNISIQSAVKDVKTGTVYDLNVQIANQTTDPGMYIIRGETADWPLGRLLWDIQYTQDTVKFSSETITIRTLENVTP